MKTVGNSNISVVQPKEVKFSAQTTTLEDIVTYLEACGGNLDHFFRDQDTNSRAIYLIEKRLAEHPDTRLKERWDKAIELSQATRMRLLKCKVLGNLERLNPHDDKISRVDLAFAKLVLGDDLAASTVYAKQKMNAKSERSSNLDAIKLDMESDEI